MCYNEHMKIRAAETTLIVLFVALILFAGGLIGIGSGSVESSYGYSAYTISPDSTPCNSSYLRYSTYNSSTRAYYTLRSYMEQLEASGGGTLVLTGGTYRITNTVYIPSNVTLILSDGVKLIKSGNSGVASMPASKSMFMLCSPSKAKATVFYSTSMSKLHGYKKYGGVHDIKIIGRGNASIDMKYVEGAITIDMAHTKNVTVSGISFTHANTSHFIEMDASYDAKVSDCVFKNSKYSGDNAKESINIDTPDLNTDGFHATWSSYDKTADNKVTISRCRFVKVPRAIGTHNYSPGHMHKHIVIKNCTIKDTESDAISAMYWYKPLIENNRITDVDAPYRGILGPGTVKPTIRGNYFGDMDRAAQFYPWSDDGYGVIYPEITKASEAALKDNTYVRIGESFIRVNKKWGGIAPDWFHSRKIHILNMSDYEKIKMIENVVKYNKSNIRYYGF